MTFQTIAKQLNTKPEILEEECLRAYLEKKLNLVSVELFKLQKKFGVKNSEELDQAMEQGKIHEFDEDGTDNNEDIFKFYHLNQEKKIILNLLKKYGYPHFNALA